jgi:type IV fimbrial biogenesis protein FimT
MNGTRPFGFTLWELLVTLLVAGILFGIGVPNVMEFQRNGAMTAAANDLVTAMLLGRTEAVKQQAPVTWCLSDDPLAATPTCLPALVVNSATRGFVVWVDENGNVDGNGARILTDATDGNAVIDAGELILSRGAPPGGTIRVSAVCGHVSFAPTGFTRPVPGLCNPNERTVLFCDDRGRRVAAGSLSSARIVLINRQGRALVHNETASVNTWAAGLIAAGAVCPP